MLIGDACRLGPPRVDEDDLPATFPDRVKSVDDIGRRHQTPVRRERVCTEDQKEVSAIDIGYRDQERMTEHRPRRKVMRQLIDRCRGKVILRLQRLQQFPAEKH